MGREFLASRDHATTHTIEEVVNYLGRLKYAGQLRAIAVAYVDASGRDHSLLAVQHLDQVGSAGVGRGLMQLAHLLAADSLGD